MMWIVIVVVVAVVLAVHVARRLQKADRLIERILVEELGAPRTTEVELRQPSPVVRAHRSPTGAHR